MEIRLIEIGNDGLPAENVPQSEMASGLCEATAAMYQRGGFVRPWLGYLAIQDGRVVGTCAFKSPPIEGRVEIAYFTFPEFEGGGVATIMARQLVTLARDHDPSLEITSQTLPEINASTTILRKLGFEQTGTAHDDDVGVVWVWKLLNPGSTLGKVSEGRTVAVVGDVYRFLATGAETGGNYAMWEALVPPGGGPPPHVHSREVEAFYVLEGEITFQIGDDRLITGPGTFANMPIGTPHSFKNESKNPAKMLITVAPAGLEQMFFEVGILVANGTTTAAPVTKAEIERLMQAAPCYGIEIMEPKP